MRQAGSVSDSFVCIPRNSRRAAACRRTANAELLRQGREDHVVPLGVAAELPVGDLLRAAPARARSSSAVAGSRMAASAAAI